MHALTADQAHVDLAGRADVEALLRRFYGQVLVDDILANPFAQIRINGLESHLPVMCGFWETVLFRAGLYQGSAVRAHQPVHDRNGLSASHFLRWLTLWNSAIDHMYRGPNAEHAKNQAARIARAMHHRLTGNDSEELDVLVQQGLRLHPRSDHRLQAAAPPEVSPPESLSGDGAGEELANQ